MRSRCWRTASSGWAAASARSRPSLARLPAPAGRATVLRRAGVNPGGPDPLRHLHAQILRGRSGAGLQLAACPARGLRRLCRQPEGRGLECCCRPNTMTAVCRAGPSNDRRCSACWGCRCGQGRPDRRLQDRSADALARRLRQTGRAAGCGRRLLRLGDAVIQYRDQHGPADAQRVAELCAVRARGDRRAGSATRSPPPNARASGWADWCRTGSMRGAER